MNLKKGTTFIAGFVVGILAIYLWGQVFSNNTDAPIIETQEVVEVQDADGSVADAETTQEAGTTQVVVLGQPAGEVVQVASVSMPKLGWVVVHEVKDGVVANALGASLRDVGEHSDIPVYLLRSTTTRSEYAVVLYEDNGDRQFSLASDAPMLGANDEFIMSKFTTN